LTAHIILSFHTTLGRIRTLRINNPNTAVTDNVVRTSMTGMINSEAVQGTTGRIVSRRHAELVEQQVTSILLPAS